MRSKVNFFLVIFMTIVFLLSMLITFIYHDVMVYGIILDYIVSLILVNNNSYSKNIINIQTIFLIGVGFFIFGRFFAVILDPDLSKYLYCIDFIFDYCASFEQSFYLNLILNLILISFSISFVSLRENKIGYQNLNKKRNLNFLCVFCFLFILINLFLSFSAVYTAITSGYMALYASQAETYQSPYSLLVTSVATASLGFLYSIRHKINKRLFLILFILYILSLMLNILTGSRAGFITGLILFLWFFYKEKKIKFHKVILFIPFFALVVFSLNRLASVTGARDFASTNNLSQLQVFANMFFSQGITLMVFNTSINVENYPLLGILKTLFPGIQIFFSFLGVDKRYQFDWSSYMTYNENKIAYDQGFGLGWSIFSDLYILSFGFLPLFCIFIYIFGLFIVKILTKQSYFNSGIIFICVTYFFSLSRGSISPFIFTLIIYTIFSIYYGTLNLGGRKKS